MPKHFVPLLLGLVSVALMAQTPIPPTLTAEQATNLKGCAALGVGTNFYYDQYGWDYTIPSPDGTYVAKGERLGSHGCNNVIIYQCVTQQSSGDLGCKGIFPPESSDNIFAEKWLSNNDLFMTHVDQTQTVDVRDYFTPDALRHNVPDQLLGLSPDGAWQVFNSYRDGMPELYRRRLDGSQVKRLTYSLKQENFYGWSADGQWLIFDYADPKRYGLLPVRMRIDGSELRPLMTEADLNLSSGRFWTDLGLSPDGRWLLMEGYTQSAASNLYTLYRLGVPDGGLERLTNPAFNYNFSTWSPDGRALVSRWVPGDDQLAFELIDIATDQNDTLIKGDFPEFRGWTSDHKAALFLMSADKGLVWYRAELDGSGSRLSNANGD